MAAKTTINYCCCYYFTVRLYQFPILLYFVHILESFREQLLVDATQVGHVLLALDVAASTTRCTKVGTIIR